MVGVGDQFPLHPFGRQPLFAAVFGQLGRLRFVVDPLLTVDMGLELPVGHQVGIASNWRSEVHIGVQIQAEMASVFLAVAGPLHQLEEALVNDASRGFRQVAGGGLCVLKRSKNAVSGFGVDDTRKVREHCFLDWLRGLHAREVNASSGKVGPVAQQVGEFIGLALTVLA